MAVELDISRASEMKTDIKHGTVHNPKVSIVIPAYGRARFLTECISSVLNQTVRDFEILLIDDGSPTREIEDVAASFPEVTYVRQENKGVSGARNKGLELSSGEYIVFLDSDDLILEDALQVSVDILDRYPNVAFSHGQAYVIDENSNVVDFWRPCPLKTSKIRGGLEEMKALILGNYVLTPTVVVRHSCLNVVGPFDTYFRCGSEDFDMWLRLAKRYDVAYINRPLGKYRIHSKNLSKTRSIQTKKHDYERIFRSVFEDDEIGYIFRQLQPRAYFSLFCRLSMIATSKDDRSAAVHYLVKALTACPRSMLRADVRQWASLLFQALMPSKIVGLIRRAKQHLLMPKYIWPANLNDRIA
jgi:glycosyltransferase involved in cell wall biosynthesis